MSAVFLCVEGVARDGAVGVVSGELEAAGFVTLVEAVGDEAEHGTEGVAAAFGVAEVIDVVEGGPQAAELAGTQGAAGSGSGLGDRFLVGFRELPGAGEEGAGVFWEGGGSRGVWGFLRRGRSRGGGA
jgi:hypothetical protein